MSLTPHDIKVRRLGPHDRTLFHEMLSVFARAFDEYETYNDHRPDDDYTGELLRTDSFIAIAASYESRVIGAIAAYELKKFEQPRSEIYVYDLAVDEPYRRSGVATAMLRHLVEYAVERRAHAVFVQADKEDLPANALYASLGKREDVFHYDLCLPGSEE